MRRGALAFAAALTLAEAGCGTLAGVYRMPRVAECPTALPRPGNLRGDVTRRLRAHVAAEGVSEGFELVLQKRGDRLTLVGLTRFGATAFTIVQEGSAVEVQSRMKPIETVPLRNLLADVYRWPLGLLATPGARVEVAADGRSATIDNDACGYRTNVADVGNGGD